MIAGLLTANILDRQSGVRKDVRIQDDDDDDDGRDDDDDRVPADPLDPKEGDEP